MAAPAPSGVGGTSNYTISGNSFTSITVSGLTTTTGRGVLAFITGQYTTNTNLAITDNKSNTWVRVGAFTTNQFATPIVIDVFYCLSLTTGGSGHNFTISVTSGDCLISTMRVIEMDGPLTYGTTTTATDSANPWTSSLTTTAADTFVIACILPPLATGGAWTLTATGYTCLSVGDASQEWPLGVAYKAAPSSGAQAISLDTTAAQTGENAPIRMLSFTSAGSSPNSYLITPSGGVAMGGNPAIAHGKVFQISGGMLFSGTAPVSSGYRINPSGGFSMSGTISMVRGRAFIPAGGVAFAGTAPLIRGNVIPMIGGVVLGGTAPMSFNGGGGGSTATTQTTLTFVGKS